MPAKDGAGAVGDGGKKPAPSSTEPAAISLPKGGGAIRGMGEKFSVTPSSGNATISIPLPVTASRSGNMTPTLSLDYNSGDGSSEFGLGWRLSMSTSGRITRKTDKGIPRYRDKSKFSSDDDIFIISGVDDLVVLHRRDVNGDEIVDQDGNLVYDQVEGDYTVRKYSPRIEGSFMRIERWIRTQDPSDSYWRTISKDNVVAVYGANKWSRIADPASQSGSQRIFSWLLSEVYDSFGNSMLFEYKEEDSAGILSGLGGSVVCERNRTDTTRSSNRYLKGVKYGNRIPNRDAETWVPYSPSLLPSDTWMFEVIFDYGEHSKADPLPDDHASQWICRPDPFSSFKSGFEVRNYRLCQRVLMFHHFPHELGRDSFLVSSVALEYELSPSITYLIKIVHSGYAIDSTGDRLTAAYVSKSLPALEFDYTRFPDDAELSQLQFREVISDNIPDGISPNDSEYQWLDLDGEGSPGVLFSEQGTNGGLYKRNTSANNLVSNRGRVEAQPKFEPLRIITPVPNLEFSKSRFLDVAGNGTQDLVAMDSEIWGFYERVGGQVGSIEDWRPFLSFSSFPNRSVPEEEMQFIDLSGDGLPDIMINKDEVYTWHSCMGQDGYGEGQLMFWDVNEETGPYVAFLHQTSPEDTITYLADMSGDGLVDIVRVRNGETCYWPNTGYGTFGTKITLGNSPWFDNRDTFDRQRIILIDIDGSGTTDIMYLRSDGGFDIYRNEAGNSFSSVKRLSCPPVDFLASKISAVDILGNGTACLVWSSTLPGLTSNMKYLDLNKSQKPHLLTSMKNNLGSENIFHYAPSTKFYLQDRQDGNPWITRLPFPVQCVETVEIIDTVSHNRFVNRYKYHHGFFDGFEREFRGFAMVESWDTDAYSPQPSDSTSDIYTAPPIHTKTWYHTGAYLQNDEISRHLAFEYFGAPPLSNKTESDKFFETLLPDTILPLNTITSFELREACRSLKGQVLRKEIYSDDSEPGNLASEKTSSIPYCVMEANYDVKLIQGTVIEKPGIHAISANQHSVFLRLDRESLSYNYERNLEDPRIDHTMVLDVDQYGNVLKSVAIAYGRKVGNTELTGDAKLVQEQHLITYSENKMTNDVVEKDAYLLRRKSQSKLFEIHGTVLPSSARFTYDHFSKNNFLNSAGLPEIRFDETPDPSLVQRRLLQHSITRYRSNDLTRLLDIDRIEYLGLTGESYQMALTPELVEKVYNTKVKPDGSVRTLLSDPDAFLQGASGSQGGYVHQGDLNWWIPSGRKYLHPAPSVAPPTELAEARRNFFQMRRAVDAFGQNTIFEYDGHFLALIRTVDPLNNMVEARMDYRVIKPEMVADINGNETDAAYDELGMLVGLARHTKESIGPLLGDNFKSFKKFPTQVDIDGFYTNPQGEALNLLGSASTRFIYDFSKIPTYTATIVRETHDSEALPPNVPLKFQVDLSYSDGFGRSIQSKKLYNPGSIDETASILDPRWITSGWVVYNNRAKQVQQFEPFFDDSHHFKFDKKIGVSSLTFYDPLDRVVGVLKPDHSWSKTVFEAWKVSLFDRNDTVNIDDPRKDENLHRHFSLLDQEQFLPTWSRARINGGMGTVEEQAAIQTASHGDTPSTVHLDALGRAFLAVSIRKQVYSDGRLSPTTQPHVFTKLDIQANELGVLDSRDFLLMHKEYDMLGSPLYSTSSDVCESWTLKDVTGQPLYTWNGQDRRIQSVYDELRRPLLQNLVNGDSPEVMVERRAYGETQSPILPNTRGKIVTLYDQAGTVVTDLYDFKGNLLTTKRRLAKDYRRTLDYNSTVEIDPDLPEYVTSTEYDALDRSRKTVLPDGSVALATYDRAGFLESNTIYTKGSSNPTAFTNGITYNAKGQRLAANYGDSIKREFIFDPITFRLRKCITRRKKTSFPDDCPETQDPAWTGCQIQNLEYVYDPVGNITNIHDFAQQTIFFRNTKVEPSTSYVYDSIYQLIEASGREHVGLDDTGTHPGKPVPPKGFDSFHTRLDHPGNGTALGLYLERYTYDDVCNITALEHTGSDPSHPAWVRTYNYSGPSQINLNISNQTSNHLTSTEISGVIELYKYDGIDGLAGSMTSMPHIKKLEWDFKNQLRSTVTQIRNDGGVPEKTWYIYDASGMRVRKVTDNQAAPGGDPALKDQRIYLGAYEVHNKYDGPGTSLQTMEETAHLYDGSKRIALIETATKREIHKPPLVRYQFDNQLSSCSLELDENALLISYEEYFPFGSTSYQAVSGSTEADKRYRYAGKEIDHENGFYYNGARYYASWLGRWINCDPGGLPDGVNMFSYARNNPIKSNDPTGTETAHAIEDKEPAVPAPSSGPPASSGTTLNVKWGSISDMVQSAKLDNGDVAKALTLSSPALSNPLDHKVDSSMVALPPSHMFNGWCIYVPGPSDPRGFPCNNFWIQWNQKQIGGAAGTSGSSGSGALDALDGLSLPGSPVLGDGMVGFKGLGVPIEDVKPTIDGSIDSGGSMRQAEAGFNVTKTHTMKPEEKPTLSQRLNGSVAGDFTTNPAANRFAGQTSTWKGSASLSYTGSESGHTFSLGVNWSGTIAIQGAHIAGPSPGVSDNGHASRSVTNSVALNATHSLSTAVTLSANIGMNEDMTKYNGMPTVQGGLTLTITGVSMTPPFPANLLPQTWGSPVKGGKNDDPHR